jgi:phosphoserine phosphatase RsbU/P
MIPRTATLLRHSLRTRLLIATVGVTGVILAAVILWGYFNVLNRLEVDARQRAAAMAEGSADKIDSELSRLQGLVQGMALVFETQALAVPFDQVRALQAATLEAHPQIQGMAIALLPELKPADWPDAAPAVYRHGHGLGYRELAREEGTYIGRDWFHLPRYLEEGTWSEPYLRSGGLKMVTYSVPLHIPSETGPRFAGVVTADIDVGWLDRVVAELPVGRHGYGFLMTHNGTYVSHPVSAVVFNETVFSIAEARGDAALRATGQRMVSGQPGLLSWISWAHQEPSWLAWHPLATTDWTMGTVVSQAELRADIRRLSQEDALVGLLGMVLLVLAVWLVARSITRPVTALGAAAATLASGDLEAALPVPKGRDEVALLTVAFGTMRDNLRRYIADLAETTAARERMNGELRIAHDIQMDLVPKTFPPFPERDDMDLFAVMEPAREVGGDFYDFFALDDERLVLAIGDVSGKGVPAALFMAVTRSFLRSAFRVDDDPGRALCRVNEDLAESNEACMFVTLFCAVVRLQDGWVDYANAGHNPPLMVDAQGRIDWIGKPYGPAAGAMPDSLYTTGRFRLTRGAMLLLYTDGVTEAMDPAGNLYGTDRLAERLEASRALDCRGCLNALLDDIRSHAAGTEQSDDITMLMFKHLEEGLNGASPLQEEGAGILRLDIANRPDALSDALDRVDAFIETARAAPRLADAVRLVLEELLTNTIKYGYDDAAEHRIQVVLGLGPPATLCIEDDGHAFDPVAGMPTLDPTGSVEDRPIGGLGLHLVRSQTASLRYRRSEGRNRLEIVFPD